MSELYVVLKLTTGEQVMAVLKEEDEHHVLVEDPMCIKLIPVLQQNKETVTAHPLCHFSADHTYVIPKRNIIFVKKMHHVFVPHYLKIVEDHQKSDFFQPAEKSADDLDWEDDFTAETARKAVQQLQEVFGEEKEAEEEINWEEKLKNLVPGNDTLN